MPLSSLNVSYRSNFPNIILLWVFVLSRMNTTVIMVPASARILPGTHCINNRVLIILNWPDFWVKNKSTTKKSYLGTQSFFSCKNWLRTDSRGSWNSYLDVVLSSLQNNLILRTHFSTDERTQILWQHYLYVEQITCSQKFWGLRNSFYQN